MAASASSTTEWNSRTERYCKAWSDELKVTEYNHLKNCEWYTKLHRIVGGVGQCTAVTVLFTTLSTFFETGADGCGPNTVCLALRITGIVMTAVTAISIALLTFYDPSSLAQQNKTSASSYNGLWRRIDLELLRPRLVRMLFWDFIVPLQHDYERVLAEAPSTRAKSKSQRAAERLVIGIGSILSSTARRTSGRKTTATAVAEAPTLPPPPPVPAAAASASTSFEAAVHSDDEGETRMAQFDLVVQDAELRNARKFEKIRRTATPRNLATAAETQPDLPQPKWYKKRMTSPAET